MPLSAPSLLITDDDSRLRQTLREFLEGQGYFTYEAGDGEEALHILERRSVHVMLLDLHMPRLGGLETLQLARKLHVVLPCILMSAELDPEVVAQARASAVFEILAKPFSVRQVASLVREALRTAYDWSGEAD
ncbi:MAG: response regulator [Thermogutta sp.]